MKEKLFLIDGTALLYRAYFAFIRNPLINSRGQNTSAIFGVINSFLSLIDKMDAKHIAIAFDKAAPTFRHLEYEQYKANRPPMPDDLASQISPVIEFFELIKVPQVGKEGFEADDALGTLGKAFSTDFDIVYVTSDKDYCQLLEGTAILYDPMKESITDDQGVYEKYGVKASQFIDYLALVGDSSDNIPGVKGIGPVAAKALLNLYPSLDAIYKDIDNVDKKYKTKLIDFKEDAYLSYHLAMIVRDAPLDLPAKPALFFDDKRLLSALPLLKRYEISSLQRRIEARFSHAAKVEEETQSELFDAFADADEPTATTKKTEPPSLPITDTYPFSPILVDEELFPSLLKELETAELVSLDTETDSLDPLTAKLVGISLCTRRQKAYYLPFGHLMAQNLPESFLARLFKVLSSKKIVGHNLKYDLHILRPLGFEIPDGYFDTMIAAYILDAGAMSFSLQNCALRELDYEMMPISELIGKGKKQSSFDILSPEDACFYAAEDAWITFRLFDIYQSKLRQSPAYDVFYKMDLPLLKVLAQMEENGVSIDEAMLSQLSHKLNQRLKEMEKEIYHLAGYEFNLNSPKQLAKLLFEDLKLSAKKKTKSGYSTDVTVLETIKDEHEIVSILMDYRQLAKLETTYVSALPKLVNPFTKRIHSTFNQCVASTGRLSSQNPNLQNIPIRTELGREVRKAFVSHSDDYYILAADYSQIELRLLALISRDQVLLNAFKNGADIHRETAAQIHGITSDMVTSDMRRAAKTINFGLLYGMGQRKLAGELSITTKEAAQMIERYFARFPSVRHFQSSMVQMAREQGEVRTIFGRTLSLPDINSKNKKFSSDAERVAINMPIQGSAADLIKRAMLSLHQEFKGNDQLKMILQVHDELVFEVHKDYVDYASERIRYHMENALPEEYRGDISLSVDIAYGKSWFEAH